MNVAFAEFEPFLGGIAFRGDFPRYIAFPLIVLGVLAVFVVYFRESLKMHPARRIAMATLRGLAIACIILLLMKPVLVIQDDGGERKLPIVVMVDASQSMGTHDPRTSTEDRIRYAIAKNQLPPDHGVQMKPDGSYGELTADEPSRAEVVSAVFQNADKKMNLLERLREKGPVQEFFFGGSVFGAGKDWTKSIPVDQTKTALLRSINELLERKEGDRPSAIVVATDGRDNDKDERISWDTVAARCRQLKVPLFIYGVGSGQTGLLQLKALNMKNVFSVHDEVRIPVEWRGKGINGGKIEISATLGGRVVVPPRVIDAVDGDNIQEMLTFRPTEADAASGRQDLVVSIKLVGAREQDTAVKSLRFTNDKVKVLYIDNVPRWEFKFLMRAFQRDKLVEATFYLAEGDKKTLEAGPPFIPSFPATNKQLSAFDLIIIGDVDAKSITAEQQEWIREFVERGGGLVMIAGKKFAPSSYLNTKIGDMLPVEFEVKRFLIADDVKPNEFHPKVSLLGHYETLMSLAQSRKENEEIWKKLPGWYWFYPVKKLKPAAVALLEHPKEEIESLPGTKRPMPLMAMHYYGKGLVFFSAIDETWRWRYNEAETHFGRFWGQIVYAVGLPHVFGGRSRLILGGGEPTLGKPSRIYVSLFNKDNRPYVSDRVDAQIKWLDGQTVDELAPQKIVFDPIENQPGEYVATVPNNRKGKYRLELLDTPESVAPLEFPVNPEAEHEQAPGGMNEDALRKLAADTGGAFYREEDLYQLPEKVSTRTVKIENPPPSEVLLWNRWWVFAIVIGLFSLEWLVRKFSNLS